MNLVSNAIKFTPYAGRIIIKADTMSEMVRINVIDNGIGLKKEEKEEEFKKLFKRFIQIDSQIPAVSVVLDLDLLYFAGIAITSPVLG